MTTTAPTRLIFQFTLFLRILLFLAAPAIFVWQLLPPSGAALIIISGTILTWLVDLAAGGTFWLAAHKGTLTAYVVFLVLAATYMVATDQFAASSLFTILVLLLALSSDAITNSQRWKLLLPVAVVAAAIVNLAPAMNQPRWGAAAYPFIPFFAALARLVFPRTKHLIHTSLDYPPVRLEILSLGMKRVAAVGIRRNSASPL